MIEGEPLRLLFVVEVEAAHQVFYKRDELEVVEVPAPEAGISSTISGNTRGQRGSAKRCCPERLCYSSRWIKACKGKCGRSMSMKNKHDGGPLLDWMPLIAIRFLLQLG